MATKILNTEMDDTPPQICFANFAGDFVPSAANDLRKGTDTEGELALLNLADGAAAQSAKIDLSANFAETYIVTACIEMQVAAATAGAVVEFYWNASPISTAGTANMGGASGAAAAYSGYSSDLANSIGQLVFIGVMEMTDDAVDSAQIGYVGLLSPLHRYGSIIVKNECGQTICDTDDIEAHITLSPIVPESQ
jgi:hypothetical protein